MSAPEQRLADSVIALGAPNVDLPTWLAAQEVVWHREQEGRGAIPTPEEERGWVVSAVFEGGSGRLYNYWLPLGVIPVGTSLVGRTLKIERSHTWQSDTATGRAVVAEDATRLAANYATEIRTRPGDVDREVLGLVAE